MSATFSRCASKCASGSPSTTCSFGESISNCSESSFDTEVPVEIRDWPLSQPEKQRMLARVFDAELQMVIAQLSEEQKTCFELQDRCQRQEVEVVELRAIVRSQTCDMEDQRQALVWQEEQLDRQTHQIHDLQSQVDEQKAIMDASASTANTQSAKLAFQRHEIDNLCQIVKRSVDDISALSANCERASRDADHLRACLKSQRDEMEKDIAAHEDRFQEARTRLERRERFIQAQNERLEVQTRELVDARRKNGQLSKQLCSVSRSLQLQEDHAVMVKRDAKEIQAKLVQLQAAQEKLDQQITELVEREATMRRAERVLVERHEELQRQKESIEQDQIAATHALVEAEVLKRQIEETAGVAAVAGGQLVFSEILREQTTVFPNARLCCTPRRTVRVGA